MKILIIEDNTDIRENLAEILELSSYEVQSTTDGEKGIKCIREDMPDLILCDIAMPGMNGYQVLEAAKATPSIARIPFIFITSSAQSWDIVGGEQAGADAYLVKPFETKQLINTINHFLPEK